MAFAAEEYISITTFAKDGTPKPTPVWPVDAGGGRVGFITSADSWKVKRLTNNDRVELRPSDARGRPKTGATPISGTATVVHGPEFDAVHAAVRSKYGFKLSLINGLHSLQRLLGRDGPPSDCAVIITLDET